MVTVVFYEKTGCINNTRQKQWLRSSGHALEVRDLLTHPWTEETLRPFFGELPVAQWFNPSAPGVKSGLVVPTRFTEREALLAMIANPLLIRRPLMCVEGECRVGFDEAAVDDWIGLSDSYHGEDVVTCAQGDVPCQPQLSEQRAYA